VTSPKNIPLKLPRNGDLGVQPLTVPGPLGFTSSARRRMKRLVAVVKLIA